MLQKTKSKKAQITYFVLIAIVLAAVVVVALSLRSSIIKSQVQKPIQEIPADLAPINTFYENCIKETAKDGFIKLGSHGGYIDPYNKDLSGKTFDLAKAELEPTESDAVVFGKSPVVYWEYLAGKNLCVDCERKSNMPAIEEIEQQLNKYIGQNLDNCLNEFEAFKKEGYEITAGKRAVKAVIAETDVTVDVAQKISIKSADKSSKLENFRIKLDFNFREVYNTALTIARLQVDAQPLEGVTLKLLGVLGSSDGQIPPLGGVSSGFENKFWFKSTVKNYIQQYLTSYLMAIQVKDTKGAAQPLPSSDPYDTAFNEKLYWDIGEAHPKISANFIYTPQWKTYFEVYPSTLGEYGLISNNVVRYSTPNGMPEQVNSLSFYYSMSYPVVVLLNQETDVFDEGYKFSFALESNIRCNKNLNSWAFGNPSVCPWPDDAVGVSLEPGAVTEFTDPVTGEVTTIPSAAEKSLFCNDEQRLSGNITIRTFDSWNSKPLPGVVVTFGCGKYRACPYETTKLNAAETTAVFKKELPLCQGTGYIKLEKEGYKPVVKEVSTLYKQDQDFGVIYMEQSKELKAEVKVIELAAIQQPGSSSVALRANARSLNADEQAIVSLDYVPEPLEESYSAAASVQSNGESTISLFSGKYNVNVMLVDNAVTYSLPDASTCQCNDNTLQCKAPIARGVDPWLAGKDCSCTCAQKISLPFGGTKCIQWKDCSVVDPYTTEPPMQTGGAELTGDYSQYISVSESKTKITFYIIKLPKPLFADDIGEIGNIAAYSATYEDYVRPYAG